jgi:cation-transporting ATPase I
VTQLAAQASSAGSRQVAAARQLLRAPGRAHRRTWVGNGRAHIEVRAVHRGDGRLLARRVERDLQALEGVDWAEVNAVLGRVVAAFDGDVTTVDALVATVEAAEAAARRPGVRRVDEHTVDCRVERHCDVVKWITGAGVE